MDIIITVFTVMSMYLNLSHSSNNGHYYNADIENGVLSTLYVYDNKSDYLVPTYASHFDYDAQGRLTEKATYKWDTATRTYEPYYKLQFTYCGNEYEIAHCVWSKNTEEWKAAHEKMVYDLDNDHLRSVTHIQFKQADEIPTVNKLFIEDPYDDYLLAMLANRKFDF